MRAAFVAALKSFSYSSNSTNPEEIQAAYERLKKTYPKVSRYATDTPVEAFLSGNVSGHNLEWLSLLGAKTQS